jgi:hypothetical protein
MRQTLCLSRACRDKWQMLGCEHGRFPSTPREVTEIIIDRGLPTAYSISVVIRQSELIKRLYFSNIVAPRSCRAIRTSGSACGFDSRTLLIALRLSSFGFTLLTQSAQSINIVASVKCCGDDYAMVRHVSFFRHDAIRRI